MTLLYDRENELVTSDGLALLAEVDADTIRNLVPTGEGANTAYLPEFILKRITRTVDQVDPLRQLDVYTVIEILAAHQRGELA